MTTKRGRQMTLIESFGNCKRKDKIVPMEEQPLNETSLIDRATSSSEERFSSCEIRPTEINEESLKEKADLQTIDKFTSSSDENFSDSNPLDDQMVFLKDNVISKSEIKVLKQWPECGSDLTPLVSSKDHTVLFHYDSVMGPSPYPEHYQDKWDSDHVRLPCSPCSMYPAKNQAAELKLYPRWEIIYESLTSILTTTVDLENAIMKYNRQYIGKWDFSGLHSFFNECVDASFKANFFHSVLPKLATLALQLPLICTQPIPLLKKQKDHAISLTQKQISCLLANAFFCTFPRRNYHTRAFSSRHTNHEYASYPEINFNRLFCGTKYGIIRTNREKLKCILNYFSRVTSEEPTGVVTFHRQYFQIFPNWASSTKTLSEIVVSSDGLIETQGQGMLQVDFANSFVGGGVLNTGCVQEEIRFVICPELIASMLFTECLGDSESLVITGVEQYNKYTGYGDTFLWKSNFVDNTPRDDWGHKYNEVVAIDALHFKNLEDQFKIPRIKRELDKAYVGFHCKTVPVDNLPAVATGNWGCGVFNGYPNLKFLIQLMAVSQAERGMLYLTFGNKALEEEFKDMVVFMKEQKMTVGHLWMLLDSYCERIVGVPQNLWTPLYEHIYEVQLGCYPVDRRK